MKKKTVHAPQQSLFGDWPEEPKKSTSPESERDFVFDLVDALSAPIVVFHESWADAMPRRFVDLVTMARLAANLQNEQLATEVECILYIYTWSMVTPINDHHLANIYIHLCCKVLEEMLGEDRWEIMQAPRELSNEEQQEVLNLRRRIYATRRAALKDMQKDEPKEEIPEKPSKSSRKQTTTSGTPADQQSLF